MQNLREYVNQFLDEKNKVTGYADIVREERYFCAVLFHCMLQDEKGMKKFLTKCGVDEDNLEVKGVFVEYAMVRDLWKCLSKRGTKIVDRNARKRKWIVDMLCREPADSDIRACREHLASLDVPSFNRLFVAGKVSPQYIQSPSRWGIRAICNSHGKLGTEILKRALILKWAFNVKPDIVVELGNDAILCIEAKVESKEGVYANSKADRDALDKALREVEKKGYDLQLLKKWIEENASQTIVQQYVMTEILGYTTPCKIYLYNKLRDKRDRNGLHWQDAFDCFSSVTHPEVMAARTRLRGLAK